MDYQVNKADVFIGINGKNLTWSPYSIVSGRIAKILIPFSISNIKTGFVL